MKIKHSTTTAGFYSLRNLPGSLWYHKIAQAQLVLKPNQLVLCLSSSIGKILIPPEQCSSRFAQPSKRIMSGNIEKHVSIIWEMCIYMYIDIYIFLYMNTYKDVCTWFVGDKNLYFSWFWGLTVYVVYIVYIAQPHVFSLHKPPKIGHHQHTFNATQLCRIIPGSKWLIAMVNKCPKDRGGLDPFQRADIYGL